MDITPLVPSDRQVISHYGNGGFTVNGTVHKGSILLLPDRVAAWEATDMASATPDSLSGLFTGTLPEIVLIGMGVQFLPLSPALRDHFRTHGIPVDAMDTGAACRTYTVLLAEGRNVAAALIAV